MTARVGWHVPAPDASCPGPLVWFDVPELLCTCGTEHTAGVLECNSCDYLVCTGGYHDEKHHGTAIIKSPR